MSSCVADGSAQYVLSEVEGNPITWFWALAFLWPLPLLLLRRHVARGTIESLLFFAEPPLIFGSLYAVTIFAVFGQPSFGCYSGWGALAATGYAWYVEARARWRTA
jgi:hypothetical protein